MKRGLNWGRERGISLFLTLIIISVLLSIGLGINVIFWGQIQVLKYMGNSVIAFYAADTGIERLLKEGSLPLPCLDCYLDLNNNNGKDQNDSTYSVTKYNAGDPKCPSPPAVEYCVQSVGVYKETRRAIQITR